jgi:hypothetical protein
MEDSQRPLVVCKVAKCVVFISLSLTHEHFTGFHVDVPLSLGIFHTVVDVFVSEVTIICCL